MRRYPSLPRLQWHGREVVRPQTEASRNGQVHQMLRQRRLPKLSRPLEHASVRAGLFVVHRAGAHGTCGWFCKPLFFGLYLAVCLLLTTAKVNHHGFEQIQLPSHAAPVAGGHPGDAVWHGPVAKDMDKPQVGIASVWYEGNTCNMHLNKLAERVKQGVVAAGMVGMRFNTIGVSDGISMGTEGMCLLAAVARPDRRLDRDGDARAMVRRQYLDSRLRQEHAGLPDRDGRGSTGRR